MSRIVILTGNSLCNNPRVFKEAGALAAAGYDVEILGAWLDSELKERDVELLRGMPFRFTQVLDATVDKSSWILSRLRVKAARILLQSTGRESSWQLGYTPHLMLHAAMRREASLFIAHSEPALWVASRLSQLGYGVGVDMEDWFSEDLPPGSRKGRPVKLLRTLEEKLLKQAVHATCTSHAMSRALGKEYGCRPPAVVYNAFPWTDRQTLDGRIKDRRDVQVPSLHWYSQTLGLGRGLEELFAALLQVKRPMEIHLRGQLPPGSETWFWSLVPENWRSRIHLHPPVSNTELLSRIAEHDMGFAGEQTSCRSRDLTVTNKILHYLLGGLAVVATETAGQREVASQADGAVQLYPAGDADALAERLNLWLEHPKLLTVAKSAALRAAEKTFCWEKEASGLVQSAAAALEPAEK